MMKRAFIPLLLPALLIFSCQPRQNQQVQENLADASVEVPRDGIFIHLSSGPEDAHRVLMAFKMAEVMSNDKDVLMYLDIQAVHLVVENAPDVKMDGFPSSLEQIRKLLESGVLIQACPTCLKVAGYTEDNLLDGVTLANKEKFFTFTKGKMVTIDY
jgi:predicted peroxiredoxin